MCTGCGTGCGCVTGCGCGTGCGARCGCVTGCGCGTGCGTGCGCGTEVMITSLVSSDVVCRQHGYRSGNTGQQSHSFLGKRYRDCLGT